LIAENNGDINGTNATKIINFNDTSDLTLTDCSITGFNATTNAVILGQSTNLITGCTFNKCGEVYNTIFEGVDSAQMNDTGTGFTDETTDANDTDTTGDVAFLPATPAVGDEFYVGSNEEFTSVEFDVSSTAALGPGDTGTWQYYNGSTWVTIPSLNDGVDRFGGTAGKKYLHFPAPSDWATVSVNTVTAYYIRYQVTGVFIMTQPLGNTVKVRKDGAFTLTDCIFRNGTDSAGLYHYDDNSTLTDCSFFHGIHKTEIPQPCR
jgi:hypothetical protein